MKKLATLILAAGMVIGATTGANAIDFKARGQWIVSFDYGEHGNFMGKMDGHRKTGWGLKNQDDFEANQRFRLWLDAVASESLSGTLGVEVGGAEIWGKDSDGGALGADGKIVKVKAAYLDWMVPETDVKVRMGIQPISMPNFVTGSNGVMDDDVAGVVASAQINEMVGVTAMWFRPYNDNYADDGDGPFAGNRAGFMDNMDLAALLVPLTFDGAKVTPWGMYGAIGPNTFRKNTENEDGTYTRNNLGLLTDSSFNPASRNKFRAGMFPVGGARHRNFSNANGVASRKLDTYGNAWWGGITGEITIWDPFRLAFDFTYGSVTWDDDGRLNRQGWVASLLAEYKLDWAIPGIYGWYASGDDHNPANGSERLPSISNDNTNQLSNFAFSGERGIGRDGLIDNGSMAGTWGIGARLKDMSFLEDIKTTFRVNLIGGTNSPTMAKKMSLAGMWANGDNLGDSGYWGLGFVPDSKSFSIGAPGLYMTSQDYALEFGMTNAYKMYENFTVYLEADYIALWLDTSKSVWGARHRVGKSIPQTNDAWNINASFVYSF